MDLYNLHHIKALLGRYNFNFTKSLGQNFILSREVCSKMAKDIDETYGVIEIGPGIGSLTSVLATKAKKVISIEIDTSLKPILQETLSDFDNVEIIFDDVLKTDIKKIIDENFKGLKVAVIANLPYYITTDILMFFIEKNFPIEKIIVLVQKEAGVRLTAKLGEKSAGAISGAINYYTVPKFEFVVQASLFYPIPKVDSAVISFDIKQNVDYNISDKDLFFNIIKSAYLYRRKTAINSISRGCNISKEKIIETFESLDLSPNLRAENLSFEQFAHISNKLHIIQENIH
ncbi:MAG: 16S rRNA (adenine(1518)-N(6)/adenine(1519)-N(6))-dimethyltransferase RsmA [Clostridia bacterium]|nr:16S rRNA (adenine(1518)-N(6)/adenine(1519)-N(6))-dimethyltransferase RsmA [Clostridia bacterium]